MPKRVSPEVKARAVRMVQEHREDYPSTTAASAAVARQLGLGRETVRRWVVDAEIDAGARPGVTSVEHAEIKRLKAENRRLQEDVDILRAATTFFAGALDPPKPLIVAFIDAMRVEGHAVESTCRVLREQGCPVAARTYRAWKHGAAVATRTLTDAAVMDALIATNNTPEGLYGRRKMTHHLRREGHQVAFCTVDRLMTSLGMNGIRRGKGVRTTVPRPGADRAGDLVNRDFHAAAPNRTWVADFTYCRTWSGFVYVAFVVDVFAQRIVAWHAATDKRTELVLTPLRMAIWQRDHDGHPVRRGELVHHADAGSQYTSIRFAEHLAMEGVAPSIGTVGDAFDNALMETVIGLFKTECIRTTIFHDGPYKTIADVEYAAMAWVDWYNTRRLHSSIGFVPPVEHETAHYAALNPEPQPV